ncbi:MAG: hypothetical protein K6G37_03310 [Bacilli bacterium]|nr:hypothetical protein [Bacilli bacterium]
MSNITPETIEFYYNELVKRNLIDEAFAHDAKEFGDKVKYYFADEIFDKTPDQIKKHLDVITKICSGRVTNNGSLVALAMSFSELEDLKKLFSEPEYENLQLTELRDIFFARSDLREKIEWAKTNGLPYFDQSSCGNIYSEIVSEVPSETCYLAGYYIKNQDIKPESIYYTINQDDYFRFTSILQSSSLYLFGKKLFIGKSFIENFKTYFPLEEPAYCSDETILEAFEFLKQDNDFIDIDKVRSEINGYQDDASTNDSQRRGI